jgi:hypothetical protein
MVHDSLYSNDKVLELEMLEQMEKRGETKTANGKTIPGGLGEEARKRIQDLRWLVSRSGKPSKPTGPRPTLQNAMAKAAAAATAVGAITSQANPVPTGTTTSTTVPQENATAAAARGAMAEANRLTTQLKGLSSETRKNLTNTLRGTTRKLNGPPSGTGGSGESLAERIARLSKLNIKGLNHRPNPGGNTGSNGGNTPRSGSSSPHTPILSANDEQLMKKMSDEAMAAATAKGLKKGTPEYDTFVDKFIEEYDVTKKGGKQRTRHARNRRNKTKRNKTNRR